MSTPQSSAHLTALSAQCESKLSFGDVRAMLRERCLSVPGKELASAANMLTDADAINERLEQVREFRRLEDENDDFPLAGFFDVRASVARLRPEGTHLEEDELFELRRTLAAINDVAAYLDREGDEGNGFAFPTLHRLTEGVMTFPELVRAIDRVVDKFGKIKDSASPALADIRRQRQQAEQSASRALYGILRQAQQEGLVEKDAAPAMRDGRLVIPVAPAMKRRLHGIVHDESASGKTVFVEPAEVVEVNNRIRELEADERREIIRILTEVSAMVRPHVADILDSCRFLAAVDFIRAKTEWARANNAICPHVANRPVMDWRQAVHPLLQRALAEQGKRMTPLDITLTAEKRILIISGPNAGGKSVCLKTAGLLQYMLQCGIPVPLGERSECGVFGAMLIDIGDEQSLENDLSTYSSHLLNMKQMMRRADDRTLILIDEFGTGTEPQIGGAIAESVLNKLCEARAWGIITTHYRNLKLYADSHEGIANGAMLYDRHEMRPLFQLQIGQPGSSFAIEIARKIGLPEDVIQMASDLAGRDYIQSDKYLQDIVRDKHYWETKRQNIRRQEKSVQQTIESYETQVEEIERQRKAILRRAKEQAEELLAEANRRIENTIREIREKQAEKEETKRIREELQEFREEVSTVDTTKNDEMIARKMQQILARRERQEQRKQKRARERQEGQASPASSPAIAPQPKEQRVETFATGDHVRMKGQSVEGTVETVSGQTATVAFGAIRTRVACSRLEHVAPKAADKKKGFSVTTVTPADPRGAITRTTIDAHRNAFNPDIDVRGMRGDEALMQVQRFIDDAILVGAARVRILHGKGNGILRQLVRDYLSGVPNVERFHDEHVQFGGAGITVAELS